MRLELAFDPSWPRSDSDGLSVIVMPDEHGTPQLRFEVAAFAPRTAIDGAELVAHGVPAGYEVRRAEARAMKTIVARCGEAGDRGRRRELRLRDRRRGQATCEHVEAALTEVTGDLRGRLT